MLISDRAKSNPEHSGFSIRRREPRDTQALFAMFSQPQCQRAMALEPFGSARDVQAWLDSRGPDICDLVASVDDTAIGFSGLHVCSGSQSHSGWFSLFIHDEFHRRGIGTVMMQAMIAISDLLAGLSRVQLIVFCDNARAICLYRRFGFEIEGRHECYARQGDIFLAAFTMARIVEPAEPIEPDQMREAVRNLLSQLKAHSTNWTTASPRKRPIK
jgi:putative acetyltransferase